MADQESFGDLNTIGQVRSVGRMGSMGGNDGRGPVDNVLPTGFLAEGNEPSASDSSSRGVRKDASYQRNTSKARSGGRR